ncbi:hypothetical protein SNEBB_000946 [Seison nebaliae]|nr:hypothetical protein SNEBB_000946 [Seison nebaliae]
MLRLNEFDEQLEHFFNSRILHRIDRIRNRKQLINNFLDDLLKELEVQEPRFISNVKDGVDVTEIFQVSANEYEAFLHLNQMGVFSFVEDATTPGSAVLKLSDGRKRSMSLWVEFITASGYLSSKKILSRFHSLLFQFCEETLRKHQIQLINYKSNEKISNKNKSSKMTNTNGTVTSPNSINNEVSLSFGGQFVLKILPSFRCANIWPQTARPLVQSITDELQEEFPSDDSENNERNPYYLYLKNERTLNRINPSNKQYWPTENMLRNATLHGFDLISRDTPKSPSITTTTNHNSNETLISNGVSLSYYSDSWAIDCSYFRQFLLTTMDDINYVHQYNGRYRLMQLLEVLNDLYISKNTNCITYEILSNILLIECEKHPNNWEWNSNQLSYRLIGVLLQLLCSLKSRKCLSFLLPKLDLFQHLSANQCEEGANIIWELFTLLIYDKNFLLSL